MNAEARLQSLIVGLGWLHVLVVRLARVRGVIRTPMAQTEQDRTGPVRKRVFLRQKEGVQGALYRGANCEHMAVLVVVVVFVAVPLVVSRCRW